MKKLKLYITGFIFLFLVLDIFAQAPQQEALQNQEENTGYSDDEFRKFALVFTEIQNIDQKSQEKMVGVVKNEGIDIQRLNEFVNASQDPGKEINATEEELKSFASAVQEIEKIQNEAQQEMEEALTTNDLTIERYQEILMAVRNDSKLQQKLQQYLNE